MRTSNLMGLALLSLSLLTVSAMACDKKAPRGGPLKLKPLPDWRSNNRPRVRYGTNGDFRLSAEYPLGTPAPYIPAPEKPAVLIVGTVTYNLDGGCGIRVSLADGEAKAEPAPSKLPTLTTAFGPARVEDPKQQIKKDLPIVVTPRMLRTDGE